MNMTLFCLLATFTSPDCAFSISRSFVACSSLIASSNASKSYTMGCWNISTTKYLRRQLSSNPLLEMVSDQRKMTFVDPNLSNSMTSEKACSELTSLSCVELTMRSSINSNASKNTKFVGVIQRQQILFVSKPIGQTPRSNMKRSLRVLENVFSRSWGYPRKTISSLGDLCFHPPSVFLVALPTIVSLPTFGQTKGSCGFYNRPSYPSSKLIGITVFDGETVSHSFFRSPETPLLSKYCSHHAKTAILWIFHPSPLRPPRQIQQSVITWWKCCFRTSSQNISPLCWHPCLSFVILLLIFNVFPPPPPHFYCFPSSPSSSSSSSSFFIVFRPPPPPPHFSCFSSTTTFLL